MVYETLTVGSGLLFPVVSLAIRWRERSESSGVPGYQLTSEPLMFDSSDSGSDSKSGGGYGLEEDLRVSLKETLDAILSSTGRLVPYDVAEITLWDEERGCCVTRGWGGDAAYAWESGGEYRIDEGYTGWLIQHQHLLFIPDVQARRDVRPKFDSPAYPFRSYIGIPLQVRGEFVGTLELASYQKDVWSERDLEVLWAVADQAAVSIGNARLYAQADEELRRREETLRRRNRELAVLYEAATATGSSLSLDAVLQTVADQMTRVLNSKGCALSLWDRARNVIETLVDYSTRWAEPAGTVYDLNDYPATLQVLETRQPMVIQRDDPTTDEAELALMREQGIRTLLMLPLIAGDRVLGLVELIDEAEARDYTPDEIRLAQSLATQAAIAIENARLYEQAQQEISERRRAEEALRRLQRVSREINATLDLGRILLLVLEEAQRLGKATHGAIILRDVPRGELRLEVCAGYSPSEKEHIRTLLQDPQAHPALAEVLRTGQSLLIPDVTYAHGQVSLRPGGDGPVRNGARSVLAVPVFYQESLAGLIFLESTEQGGALDRGVLEFVEGLSAQAAMAIGNARRYQEQLERGELLRRRADQLASVLDVSQALRSDRPLEEVLEEVAYAVQESVGFNLVLISVVEGDPPLQRRVASAGLPLAELERMKRVRQPWSIVADVMSEEFRISQSYYIPAEQQAHRARLHVYEEEAEGIEREQPGRWHPHDMLLVPLVGPGGDVRGLLSVDKPRDGRVPNRATVEVLEIFAAQAAIAIENAHLVETLQRRAETLTLFNEVSRSVTAKLELSEVLNIVVEMAPRLLVCDYSGIFLLDAESGRYVLRAASDPALVDGSAVTFAPGEGLVGAVAESGMPLAVDDVGQEPRAEPALFEGRMASVVLAPLTVGIQVVGTLCVGRREPHRFSPAEVATLSALADQVAVAVENARLFDEVRRFSQELEQRVEERTQALAEAMRELTEERDRVETLYRITSQLSISLDLDRVLNRALELVLEAVGAERAAVLMLDQNSGRLIYRAAQGTESKLPHGGRVTRFSRGEGLAGWVVEHREAAIVPDIRVDPRWIESQAGERKHRSALAVPLLVGEEVLGALLLFHAQPDYFDENHLLLVETAAIQVANAINNAELYSLIRDQAERLGSMLKAHQVEAAKSQAILEAVADGVIVADAEGRIILFNAAAERILELPREKALGRTTSEMLGLYGSQARDWMETVGRWMEQPDVYTADEYLAARLDIGNRVVSVHLAPVLIADEFLGTVSVFRDVTAEVEAERAKTEFVSTVSHELRTPMTSIKGYVDLLTMGAAGKLTREQQRFLSIVQANVDRLTVLVGDLLDISRIESGRMAISPRLMNLEMVVNQVILEMGARASEKRLLLRSDISPALPPVFADPDRVAQVLANLVTNACHYTPVSGEVVVSAYAQSEEVYVAVRDTGIGIAPEDQEKIFDRFFRADNPLVQESPGAGLGLSIVQSLVHMQGGRVWVESELGVGSTFTFTIPIAKDALAAETDRGPEPAAVKVLVVEDDPDTIKLIQLHLTGDGREVLITRREDEALKLARQEQPDLITLNVLFSDGGGLTVLEELKSDPGTQDIPVLVMAESTALDDAQRQQVLALGAARIMSKPFSVEELVREIEVVVRR